MAFKLALSAGHYMNTAGKRCLKSLDKNETREWWLNDRIADKIQSQLSAYDGIEILRLDDTTGKTDVSLTTRSDNSNKWGADFYLAIHHNAGIHGGSGGGIVAYIYNGTVSAVTKEWQKELYNELIRLTGLKGNRATPLAASNLHECREPYAPAVLLELGFMDSKVDVPIILTDDFATKCATACVNVIVKRAGLKKKTTQTTTTTTVKAYKVVTTVKRYSSAADAKAKKNSVGTYEAGTYYFYNKYPNGVDGMYNISKDNTGKSAGSWINPAENVVTATTTTESKVYRVRTTWADSKSQKGAFSDLNNAKECCQAAGSGYHVFDWDGKIVYSYVAPVAVTLSSISVTTKPKKVEYTVGDAFDASGMVVTATYSDKSTKTVTGYTTTGFSSTKAGTVTITVTFEKKTASFTVNVKDKPVVTPTLSSITVKTAPAKTVYTVGEKYDGTGLVVTAKYSDNSNKVITGYSVSGFNSSKAGTNIVTVSYEGKVATFQLIIKEAPTVTPTAVYDLDYPEKTKIIDRTLTRTNRDCVKAIKKILSNNTSFDVEIAKKFFEIAPVYGIDPLMAIAQSILETGWFKYAGSAVKPEQHNYCGLGVTSNGVTGAAFDTIADGVTAQLQHLFAYGCKDVIPAGDKVLDPRFNLVTRGIAIYWQQLAGRWACPGYDKNTYTTPEAAMKAGNTYGQKIRAIYNQLVAVTVTDEEVDKYFGKDVPTTDEPKPTEPKPTETKPVEPESSTTPNESDEPDETADSSMKDDVSFVFKWLRKIIEAIISVFRKGE